MPRQNRSTSQTGWAHVILRGINRENLFFDEEDYQRFLSTTDRFTRELGAEIEALCLMSNHVHLLLREDNGVYSQLMKKITVSYAIYYNKKYERVGHVFQDRFRSEPINDERYLLAVLRYIFRNPQKAGICRSDEYPYTVIPQNGVWTEYFTSPEDFHAFLNADNDDRCMEYDSAGGFSDDEVLSLLKELSGSPNPFVVQTLERERRNEIIRALKKQGVSVRHISRLTGINRNTVQRA